MEKAGVESSTRCWPPKGVAEAFLKFSKRLARSPEQCVRLGWALAAKDTTKIL